MTSTNTCGIANFNYVMDTILDRDDSSRLKSCLKENGINDITSLISLNGKLIDTLYYEDPTKAGVIIKPNLGDKNLIKCFLHYIKFLEHEGTPVNDRWTSLKDTDFDDFRVSPKYISFLSLGVLPWKSTVPAQHTTTSLAPITTSLSVASFIGDIKKDQSSFPTIMDEKVNDTSHRSFVSQARAPDVSEILDKNYKDIIQEEKDLFEGKQNDVFAVLQQKVFIDRGKSIVRSNKDNFYETPKRVILGNAVVKLVETRLVKTNYNIIVPMSFENCCNPDTTAEHDQQLKDINKDKDQVFMHEIAEDEDSFKYDAPFDID